jgi:hypothetical protein
MGVTNKCRTQTVMINISYHGHGVYIPMLIIFFFHFAFLNNISFQNPSVASGSSCGYLAVCLTIEGAPCPLSWHQPPIAYAARSVVWAYNAGVYLPVCSCPFVYNCASTNVCMRYSATLREEITKIINVKFATEVYIKNIKAYDTV